MCSPPRRVADSSRRPCAASSEEISDLPRSWIVRPAWRSGRAIQTLSVQSMNSPCCRPSRHRGFACYSNPSFRDLRPYCVYAPIVTTWLVQCTPERRSDHRDSVRLAARFALAATDDQERQEKSCHDPEHGLHHCWVHRLGSPFLLVSLVGLSLHAASGLP